MFSNLDGSHGTQAQPLLPEEPVPYQCGFTSLNSGAHSTQTFNRNEMCSVFPPGTIATTVDPPPQLLQSQLFLPPDPPSANTASPTDPGTKPTTISTPASQSSTASVSQTKRPLADIGEEDEDPVVRKRQRNTLAARRCRQKRLDRISALEQALEEIRQERDDLRLKLARSEAAADAMRELLRDRR